jgi:glutathione peroxidase
MGISNHSLQTLGGEPIDLGSLRGKAVLVVNVASKCGLTPQYTGLESLQEKYADQGFTVLGLPCNQFGGQEPGTHEEIAEFCSTSYGVTFPITEKVDVNGQKRHPLYEELTAAADATGQAGDIQWNFEKFLVSPTGDVVGRFRPPVSPDSDEVVGAIESALPRWKSVPAAEVRPGDVVRAGDVILTVTTVETDFFGRDGMVALIEDTPDRWFKRPVPPGTDVEVLDNA